MGGGAEVSLTPRQLWIRRIEAQTGLAPLNFKMARYIDAYNIRGRDGLVDALASKELSGIGEGTINKLKRLADIEVPPKKVTWKQEAKRLYALLDAAGIEYIKQK